MNKKQFLVALIALVAVSSIIFTGYRVVTQERGCEGPVDDVVVVVSAFAVVVAMFVVYIHFDDKRALFMVFNEQITVINNRCKTQDELYHEIIRLFPNIVEFASLE